MGRQIVKQPNGKFCIFSTYVDSVIAYDLTSEDVVDIYVEAAAEEIKRQTNQRLSEIAETPQEDVEDIWNHMLTVCERHMESDDFKRFIESAITLEECDEESDEEGELPDLESLKRIFNFIDIDIEKHPEHLIKPNPKEMAEIAELVEGVEIEDD